MEIRVGEVVRVKKGMVWEGHEFVVTELYGKSDAGKKIVRGGFERWWQMDELEVVEKEALLFLVI